MASDSPPENVPASFWKTHLSNVLRPPGLDLRELARWTIDHDLSEPFTDLPYGFSKEEFDDIDDSNDSNDGDDDKDQDQDDQKDYPDSCQEPLSQPSSSVFPQAGEALYTSSPAGDLLFQDPSHTSDQVQDTHLNSLPAGIFSVGFPSLSSFLFSSSSQIISSEADIVAETEEPDDEAPPAKHPC
jgi:hypothetical protein